MELFSLLAKLTLDKKDFDSQLDEAAREAGNISMDEPSLGLDTSEFESAVDDAESTEVEDPEKPELGLDTTEFDQGVEDVEANSETFAGSLKGIFKELSGVLVATGIVGVVTGIVSTLKEGVELARTSGDAIDKQSQAMGISKKAYQEWDYVLNLCGGSVSDLQRGLRVWQQSVGDEKKTEELAGAFESLGMDAEAAIKKIEKGDLDSVLNEAMGKLADYNKGDRGLIAETLFGRGANGLNALFNATSEDIEDMKKEAHDLGLIMTDEEIANAAAYNDSVYRLDEAVKALKTALVTDLLPFLTDVNNLLAGIVGLINPRSGEPTLVNQLEQIDTALATNVTNLEQNEAKADSLLTKLIALGDYNTLDDQGKKTWDTLANELILLFPELDKVIDTDTHTIKANTEEIRENIRQWTKLQQQRLLDEALAEKREAIAKQYATAILKNAEAEVKESDADGKRATAIEQLNAVLEKNEELRNAVKGRFGVDRVNADNAEEIFNFAREFGLPMGTEAVEEWAALKTEAEKLREEATKLDEEANQASEDYDKVAKALADHFDLTIDETEEATTKAENYATALGKIPSDVTTHIHAIYDDFGHPHAIGSDYIPYDNYHALLHRGEKVLTATEARQQDNGNVNVADLEDRIIAAIREGMADANVTAVVTDRQVAKGSNRYNGNEMDARRFMP